MSGSKKSHIDSIAKHLCVARQHRDALMAWQDQRVAEGAFISDDGSYGGLDGDSFLILGKRRKTLRYSLDVTSCDKKYIAGSGEVVTTKVCDSLESLVRELGERAAERRWIEPWLQPLWSKDSRHLA